MNTSSKRLGVLAGAVLALGVPGAASAAETKPKPAGQNCFSTRQWDGGWKAPDENTLYLRVNLHDIYRLDLSSGSPLLKWPDTHLVNIVRGSDYICTPLDLELSVADNGGGAREFLLVKTITKLTPEQVAAIPKKDLP